MAAVRATKPALASLAENLDAYAAELAARPSTGYDWVFPSIYAKTTRHIGAASGQPDFFLAPEVVLQEVSQFYEVYARNANAWLRGERAESQWRRAAAISRALGELDFDDDNERRGAALLQAFGAIYAHICVDLPRALLVVYLRQPSDRRADLATMKADFFRANALFIPVVEELIREAKITPRLLARVWGHLPSWLQKIVLGSKGPLGVGSMIRASRQFAWMRFRAQLLRTRYRTEALALPFHIDLTPLEAPADGPGPRPPANSRSPGPLVEETEDEAAFVRFLETGMVDGFRPE